MSRWWRLIKSQVSSLPQLQPGNQPASSMQPATLQTSPLLLVSPPSSPPPPAVPLLCVGFICICRRTQTKPLSLQLA